LSAIKQKVKTENNGNIDGIENMEAVIIYEFDTNRGYVEMELDNEVVAILIESDKLYVKNGETDKYVDFSDSIFGKMLLSTINFTAFNENYKELDNKMLNLIKTENLSIEDDKITVNGKNEKVKKITAIIPQEEANEILSEYMKTIVENTMNAMINELAEFQISMEEGITGETVSDEEKNKIKETLSAEIEKQIQEQLQAMNFSDIKNIYYIKDNILLKHESVYSVTVDSGTSNVKTTSETIEYGNNVRCPEISKEDIVSIEYYLNN
jgi:uncharacterized protein (UPF0305 family)